MTKEVKEVEDEIPAVAAVDTEMNAIEGVAEGTENTAETTKVVAELAPLVLPEVPEGIRYFPAEGESAAVRKEEAIAPITDEATIRTIIGSARSKKAILITVMLLAGYTKSEIVKYFATNPFKNDNGAEIAIPFQIIFPIWTKLKNSALTTVVMVDVYKPGKLGADGLTAAQRKAQKAEELKAKKLEEAANKAKEVADKSRKTSGQMEAELLAKETEEKIKASEEASQAVDGEAVAKL